MPPATKFAANPVYIDLVTLRTGADSHLAFCEFFEEQGHNNRIDAAHIINESINFVVLNMKTFFGLVGKRQTGDLVIQVECGFRQNFAQELHPSFWIALVKLVGDSSRVDSAQNQD